PPRLRQRLLALVQRQDWRAVGAAIGVGLGLAIALAVALWVMSGPGQAPLLPAHRASAPVPVNEKPPASGSEAEQARRAPEDAARTPWLAFALAKARRLNGESIRGLEPGDFAPAIVLQAEAFIDAGEAGRARELLNGLLERVPAHSRARLVLAEARLAGGQP